MTLESRLCTVLRVRRSVVVSTVVALTGCGARSDLLSTEQEPLELLPICTEEGATRECETICGTGIETCIDEKWQNCSAERPKPPKLAAIIRDFRSSHPDMEIPGMGSTSVDPGIVQDTLGPDDKPVYASRGPTATTSGRTNFNEWYRTDPAGLVNVELQRTINLEPAKDNPGLFLFRSSAFFPIDGDGFGDEGRGHNFHFTLETSTAFRYVGEEVFSFTGDDDLWVFINRRLVIDLGGIHTSLTESVELDELAEEIGLELGEVYPLHLFFAERHTIDSNFNIETTIAEFEFCE